MHETSEQEELMMGAPELGLDSKGHICEPWRGQPVQRPWDGLFVSFSSEALLKHSHGPPQSMGEAGPLGFCAVTGLVSETQDIPLYFILFSVCPHEDFRRAFWVRMQSRAEM